MNESLEFAPIPAFLARAKWPKVVTVARELHPHHVAFHEALKRALEAREIDYRLVHGTAAGRNGIAAPDWAEAIENRPMTLLGMKTLWQPALPHIKNADLVIVSDEDTLLLNYLLQGRAAVLRKPKVAVWGHRYAPDASLRGRLRKRLHGFWSTRAHWWFVNNEAAMHKLEERGFSPERIALYDDGIDIEAAIRELDAIEDAEVTAAKRSLGMNSSNVGLFLGTLTSDQRLAFAVEATKRVRTRVPDFHLVIVGSGPDEPVARDAHRQRFMHYLGPRAGPAKSLCAKLAKLLVMPGRVGLSLLEGFAYGLPLVTTAAAREGGELDHLVSDQNGVLVENANDLDAYAKAIADLLLDEPRRLRLAAAGREATRQRFTIEAMAKGFADGIARAVGE